MIRIQFARSWKPFLISWLLFVVAIPNVNWGSADYSTPQIAPSIWALELNQKTPSPFTTYNPKLGWDLKHALKLSDRPIARQTSFLKGTSPGLSTFTSTPDPPARPISPVVQIAAFFLNGSGQLTSTPRTGSGIIIKAGSEELVLTASHVVRETTAGCGQPIDPESPMADIIIILVSEDPNKPPTPRFIAVPTDVESLQFDLALLRIDKTFQDEDEGIQNLDELKRALEGLTEEEFEEEFTTGLPSSLDLPVMLLGSSESVQTEIPVKVRGYPVTSPLPRITVTEGSIAETRPEEGFFLVNRAFATFGNSGGAVVDMETNFLVGVLCGGEQSPVYAGEMLAKGVLIDRVQALIDPPAQGIRQPPVARFYVSPAELVPKEPVTFDASASFDPDPDGQVTKYEWDFDRDGEIDAEGKKVNYIFADPGPKRVMLKVTDADDLTTPKTQTVFVSITEGIPGKVIQDAIDAAEPGGTVIIEPGDYLIKVSLRIEKPLTLQGAERDIVRLFGDGEHPVILISNTANVRVEGVTISLGRPGILVENSRSVTLANITVEDNLRYGILLRRANVDILESEITHNAVDVDGRWGRGIQLSDTLRATIANNTIAENDDAGIGLFNAAAEIRNNTINANRNKGISVEDGSIVTIPGNLIEENVVTGVSIIKAEVEIRGGEIAQNQPDINGDFGNGIEVGDDARLVVAGAQISGNREGFRLLNNATVEIQENTFISDNRSGLYVKGSATATLTDSTVSENEIGLDIGGLAQVKLANSAVSGKRFYSYYGLVVGNSAQMSLENTIISDNRWAGLVIGNSAQANLSSSIVSNNVFQGLSVFGSATVEIRESVIKDNDGCGIWVFSQEAKVSGTPNEMRGNGPDLCGFAPALLRKPLASQTDETHLTVPGDFGSLQEAVDAIAPGGTITVAVGIFPEGLTLWKPVVIKGAGESKTMLKTGISIIADAEGVVLEELAVKGIQGERYQPDGLYIYGQATLRDVQISGEESLGLSLGLFAGGEATVSLANSAISSNRIGLVVSDSATVNVTNSVISKNGTGLTEGHGILLEDSAQAEINGSIISGNADDGIRFTGLAEVTIEGNKIINNKVYGISLNLIRCGFEYGAETFAGHVSGRANIIPGPEEPDGNGKGAVCPKELDFLMTEEGGEYP